MCVAYKNFSMKSCFSQTPPSISGFDSERGAFCADLNLNKFQEIVLIDQMFDSECTHCFMLFAV